MKAYLFPLVSMALAASCGYAEPYRVAQSSAAPDGVKIDLAGQQCYVNRSAEQFPTAVDEEALHLAVKLQLANPTSHPAQISLDKFHLSDGGPASNAVLPPGEQGVVVLPPGETRTIALDFEERGAVDCHHEFVIDARDAVALVGAPPAAESIRFQPSR